MSASCLRLLGFVVASSWLVAGCSSEKKIDVGGTCIMNSDCTQPLVCTMGKCHAACRTSTDCPAGQSCITASDQSTVCQLPVETRCIYASDCQPPLICAVDRQCRNQCKTGVDCRAGQICSTSKTCAEPNQVDSNKNLLAPDGGFGGSDGASGGDAPGSCPAGTETCSCYPNDTCNAGLTCASHLCVSFGSGGGAGGKANSGDASATGGSASTGGPTSTGGTDAGTAIGTGGMGGAAGGTTSADGGCPAGSETCACYPNDTCNGALICASHLCVALPTGDAGGAGGTSSAGGAANTGGADASVGTARDSAVGPTFADAAPDVPVDAAGGVDTSAYGGASGTGGTTNTGGITNSGGTTATGGITSTGGNTSSPPDAGVDSLAAADATPASSQTVALFHFDGIATPTVLTDGSGTGKVATITGNPVISTAQSRFGGASLYINGNSSAHTNYVTVDGGDDFNLPGDFTLDFWFYPVAYPNPWGGIVGIVDPTDANSATHSVALSWNSSGAQLHFMVLSSSTAAPTPNAWHHVAITRAGTTFRAFFDGTVVYTNPSSSVTFYGLLTFSNWSSNGDNGDFNGFIDEVRVVKGTAVWTSDFTPPTAAYGAPGSSLPDGGALDASAVIDMSLGDAVTQEQNLMLWLNAATITGLADGANVVTWSDGSGNGRNVSAAGTPPTYRVDQMNGLPIVRFDGSDDELSTAGSFGPSGDPSFTVTLVAKISSSNSPSSGPNFWAFDDMSHALTGACLQWRNGTVDVDTGYFNQAYPPANSFAAYADVPSIVTIRRTPGQVGQTTEFFFDGTKQTVTGVSAVPTMTDGLFYVGSWRGQRSIMDIAELLAYGIALTDADRVALECSLGAKYSITVAGCI
jgi:Concanavalin A-like lectin/glucanases superfamily